MDSISVLIPTLNRHKILIDTIISVRAISKEVEIIICDQSDNLINTEMSIFLEKNNIKYWKVAFKSLTKARNFLVNKASQTICLFIDDDVELCPCYFSKIIERFTNTEITGLTGPSLKKMGILNDYINLSTQEIGSILKSGSLVNDASFVHNPQWLVGCNHAYRKIDILKAGMYNEFFYGIAIGEDAEMSVRILRVCGGRLLYEPTMKLVHLQTPTGGCRNKKFNFIYEISKTANSSYFCLCISFGFSNIFLNQIKVARSNLINRNKILSIYIIYFFLSYICGVIYAMFLYVKSYKFIKKYYLNTTNRSYNPFVDLK